MSQGFSARFSREEMEAIRKSLRDETRFGADFMARLKRVAKHIPFAEDLLAAWFCARDPGTPRRVRLTLLAALGYFVLPTDAIPDIMPLIGFSDDAAVIAAAIAAVAGSIKPEHRERAKAALAGL
ncbi:YkvA family protein [Bosea minatitlanensis]|uniref:YkvA family protein n=1 Tax=Bosea minatitlanensis TaxID=128782 RepID=A0ABW0F9M6_9HYPH|nr:YkvA family protein [Bosea minatitlanensis]MCT4495841.1 YkvA family protein [Bosea minatitlanensis]